MKKLFLMAVAAFAFTLGANAQMQQKKDTTNKTQKEWHGKKGASQMAELNLTQAQKDQMKKIRQDEKAKIDAIKNDKSLTETQKSDKIKELRKNQHKEMNSVLTKEQKAQMKTMRAERGKKRGMMRHQKQSQQQGQNS